MIMASTTLEALAAPPNDSTKSLSSIAPAPRIMAATNVTSYDSKTSAAIPAQSPTLSPTLSAIVAALRGSSSGIPFSTLPTRSAPTSAALVKMPPPMRMNRAASDPLHNYPHDVARPVDDWRRLRRGPGRAAGRTAGLQGDLLRVGRHAAGP